MTKLKEVLKSEDTFKIIPDLAKAMLDRHNRRRHRVTEKVLGKWKVNEVKYFSYDPDNKPDAKDFALVTLQNGSQIMRLPLGAITGAMVVSKDSFDGEEPYIQGKKVYRTSKLSTSEAIQYMALMEDDTIVIPKEVDVVGIEVIESSLTGEIIIQSGFYLGYSTWARRVNEETGSYPSIFDFQTELKKPADKRHEAIPAGMDELTLIPGVDAKHPKVEHCATRLYIADAVE